MQDDRKEQERRGADSSNPDVVCAPQISEKTENGIREKKKSKKPLVIVLLVIALLFVSFVCVFFWDKFASDLFISESEEQTEEKVTKEKPQVVTVDDEIRGVYIASVSNINFPSRSDLSEEALRGELDAIVENSRRIGFDTIYFQARPSGDALYDSELFPTSRYLSGTEGKDVGVDPLAYLIERASEYDMDVVAWVNPYRVTAFKADSKEKALKKLSDENFAKIHPEHTVFYGGKLYYNPASEEVRKLICDGVKEICEGYEVAGILFDDYFYPYPVDKESFDDAHSYEAANTSLSLGDWRRENVNKMVKATYDTVKGISSELTFGISPFGIWKNASSDPRGSDTRGLEAYSSLYCDALAWIEGGYIDYISPQIYWERGYSAADFATLTRWWSAQVDGTDVKLVISHAAYRAGEFKLGGDELVQQIQYARSFMGSAGNIQYGYEDIKKNTAGVCDSLTELYKDSYKEEDQGITAEGVAFIYPGKGVKTTDSARFVTLRSDPAFPVYSETGKVPRTKNGFASILVPLSVGTNTLTLSQNGKDYSLTMTRLESAAPSTLKKFQIQSITPSPKDGVLVSSGAEIPVSVTAPRDCQVSVSLGDQSVTLRPTLNQKGSGDLIKEVYRGSIRAPFVSEGEEALSVGKLSYSVSGFGKTLREDGAEVRVLPASLPATVTVSKDYSYLKKSPDSSFYDDFLPASAGMQDEFVAEYDGFYQLGFGGFVSKESASLQIGSLPAPSVLSKAELSVEDKISKLKLDVNSAPPLDVKVEEDLVKITLFFTENALDQTISLNANPLFQSAQAEFDEEKSCTVLTLKLISAKNYYGFDHAYSDGSVVFSFRNPTTLAKGDKPLAGKRIVVDAGHGGTDKGMLGYLEDANEKDMNLAIALNLREELEELGATVIMTRIDDVTVSLTERMDLLQSESPDLSISVHHNSVNEATDANNGRGTLGLYWSAAGRSLAEAVLAPVPKALHIRDCGVRAQKLALCRNHRFPQTLVETAFLCSPAEYEAALRGDYTETCAKAMAQGVLNWYRMQEDFLKEANV